MNSKNKRFKRVKTTKWNNKGIQTKITKEKLKKRENSNKDKNSNKGKKWTNKNQKLKKIKDNK